VLAAALAAQRASDVERAVLMELAEKLEGSKLSMVYIDRDADVHRAIYAAAHNPYLEATLNQYLNAALRIWHYALRSLGSHSPHPCDQTEVVAVSAKPPRRRPVFGLNREGEIGGTPK
jgi:DNA-binding FadR family transcriptional regulator